MAARDDSHGSHSGHFIIPVKTYWLVFAGLIFLTVLTVILAGVDLGSANVPVALTIAVCKATLVAMFFMALKYDKKINVVVLSVGIMFVIVFIGFTLIDTTLRDKFNPESAVFINKVEEQEAELRARDSLLIDSGSAPSLVNPPDTLRFPMLAP